MKKIACLVVLLVSCPVHAATGTAQRIIGRFERRPLPAFHLPRPVRRTLSNGMRCYFLEDHTLPLVSLRIFLPTGSVYDPPGQSGLNGMMLSLLRTGGTTAHKADEVDAALDRDAIGINFESGMEVSSANLRTLADKFDTGLKWLVEMLYSPAFEDGRLNLAKGKVLEALRRQNETPEAIIHREFRKAVFGGESPWAVTPSPKAIKRIGRDELKSAHSAALNASRSICAVAGDIKPDKVVSRLEELLVPYKGIASRPRTPPTEPVRTEGGIFIVKKKSAQSAVSIGHRGGDRFNPDKYTLVVMNEVLGSSHTFTSWLTSKIRTERGLAYEVWSSYGFGPTEAPGLFTIHAKTRPEKAGEVIELVKEALSRMTKGDAITEGEVRLMKESVLKRSVFEYEEPFNIVSETARFVWFGLPEDYLEKFRQGIAAVTLADVKRVAGKYLHPDALRILIVGDLQKMSPGLHQFGPIKNHPFQ